MFSHKKAMIIDTKKDMQKVYKKLLAHPLFVSDYVVYYARTRASRVPSILVSLLCVTLLFGLTK